LTVKEAIGFKVPLKFLRLPDNREDSKESDLYTPFEYKNVVEDVHRFTCLKSSGEEYSIRYKINDFIYCTLEPQIIKLMFIRERLEEVLLAGKNDEEVLTLGEVGTINKILNTVTWRLHN
jgi:hypothetical protein